MEGHLADELLADCLEELRVELEDVKFLGSYPAVGAGSSEVREQIAVRRLAARDWIAGLRAKLPGAGS